MADTMSVTSREKAALIVFLGLIILSLLGFGWYLFAGHSWNVAASNIDDTFGSMEGYTAIVYPGTNLPEDSIEDDSGGLLGGIMGKDADDAVSPEAQAQQSSNTAARNAKAAEQVPKASKDSASVENGAEKSTESTDDTTIPSVDSSEGVVSSDEIAAGSLSKKKTVTVEQAKESYESKNATVFSLDTTNLEQYREGTILKKGNHRFGVFSVVGPTSSIQLEKHIAYFKRYAVDFIVVITPDKSLVEGVAGLDIVICTQDEGLFVMGETHNGIFYVDTPEIDRIGAILISPSNVVSAKVIEEL